MTSGISKEREEKVTAEGEIRLQITCIRNKSHSKLLSFSPDFSRHIVARIEDGSGDGGYTSRDLSREIVVEVGELLCGKSQFFIKRPGPNSPILGKCAVCGADLKYTVEERGPESEGEDAGNEGTGGKAAGGAMDAGAARAGE
jgi:hypothetical protein